MNRNGGPSISIVMALRNKESTIKRAINSVLNQTVRDFELIIVDGSTDHSTEIVRAIDDKRIVLIPEIGKGVGAARNQGIEKTTSDLVAFLDADDEYLPNYLETAIKMSEDYPQASAFFQRFEVVERNGIRADPYVRKSDRVQRDGIVHRYFRTISEGGVPMTTSSVVVSRELLLALGGFKTNVWYGEDTDLWGRIALNNMVAFDHNIGTIYHRDSPNRLSDKRENPGEHVFIAELERAIQKNAYGKHDRADIEEYINKLRFSSVYRCLLAGDSHEARSMLRKVRTKKYRREKMIWWCWSIVPYKLFLRVHT
jgi:glycosyltransferase involved in cell wall biosynthesis